jgi:ABC-type microcin C transport system duplicated ATPase subunit YejF
VGESGCGKTTLGRAAIRLIEPTSGEIFFERQNITRVNGSTLRSLRRGFQMIFQDPYGSLDPRLPVEDLIGEALDIHGLAGTSRMRSERVANLPGRRMDRALPSVSARTERRPTPAHRHRAHCRRFAIVR